MAVANTEPNLKKITLKIDGQEVTASEGSTILDAAKGIGINIPTLCYHKALSPFGSCRLCSVEIVDKRGRSRIVTSCNYPVEEGLVVYTKSEKTIKVRKLLLDLLLARTPNVQKIKDLAHEYGIEKSSFWTADENEDCVLCGLCTRVCDELVGVNAIDFANRGVEREVSTPYHTFSNDCIGCGACAMICPTKSKRTRTNTYPTLEEDGKKINQQFLKGTYDETLGVYSQMFSAKSSVGGQDGGVATSLMISGMQKSIFDSAVVVNRLEGYQAGAVVVENADDLAKAKGTKYLRVKMLWLLNDLISKGKRKIGVIGTPCEVRGARRIQQTLLTKYPDLQLTIVGLFCFEAFDYDKLKIAVQKQMGIDLDKVEKTQIHKGKFIATSEGKDYAVAVKDLGSAQEHGCNFCDDFSNKYADISVGSVGSPDGYSTVIVRSEVGEKLLEKLQLTTVEVNRDEIVKLATLKLNRAKKNFAKIIQTETSAQFPVPTPNQQ
ncbi:MAG TPA: Coenzyme F420 hydrogenase/dehydrogenase, beta subunit C-terminal domain [Candidatus Acidoferrum sp.]|nr:Coenzyme F420 hydrogenase/dehydrogenase, beta subunit C-terminal domain [Candidatus Acidoferrum sp.]